MFRNMSDLYKNLDKCSVGDEIDVEVLREQVRHRSPSLYVGNALSDGLINTYRRKSHAVRAADAACNKQLI